MKKVLSLLLVTCLLLSCSATVLADGGHSTKVRYVGTGDSEWELDVPSQLAPSESGNVILSGTWDSLTTVNVTADETVTLSNDVDESTKVLDITFANINQVGNMDEEILVTKPISVAAMNGGLFGIWEGIFNYYVTVDSDDDILGTIETIPEGAAYYVGLESTTFGEYNNPVAVYTEGEEFPKTVNDGDVFVYGDYVYKYNYYIDIQFPESSDYDTIVLWRKSEITGWGVAVVDKTKTTYSEILNNIAGEPVTSLRNTFEGCCIQLSPKIPNSVVDLYDTYKNSWLMSAPIIPENVEDLSRTFEGCERLEGELVINCNPTSYTSAIVGTNITSISGSVSETIKESLLEEKAMNS